LVDRLFASGIRFSEVKPFQDSYPNMQPKSKIYRQGDVLIIAVDTAPTTVTLVPRSERGVVLAEGEVTGHAHRIPSRQAQLFRDENDVRYLRVGGTAPVALQHEEHAPVQLPPGNYRIQIHTEYVPGELPRTVAD